MRFTKNLRLIIPIIVLAGVIFFAFAPNSKSISGDCAENYRNDKQVKIGAKAFETEVVQSPYERQKGLSGRDCIGSDQGMLFVFAKPDRYSMWMKDMKFPIDIIWISEDKKVVGLERNVDPSTYPDSFANRDKPALYVFEIKAGQTAALNVSLDTPVNF